MKVEAVFVVGEGRVTGLAGGPLSLADMGPRTTKRVSKIEFHEKSQRWQVLDPELGEGDPSRIMAEFDDYGVALEWERDWFNRQLLAS
jgi:hypothetical protein